MHKTWFLTCTFTSATFSDEHSCYHYHLPLTYGETCGIKPPADLMRTKLPIWHNVFLDHRAALLHLFPGSFRPKKRWSAKFMLTLKKLHDNLIPLRGVWIPDNANPPNVWYSRSYTVHLGLRETYLISHSTAVLFKGCRALLLPPDMLKTSPGSCKGDCQKLLRGYKAAQYTNLLHASPFPKLNSQDLVQLSSTCPNLIFVCFIRRTGFVLEDFQ